MFRLAAALLVLVCPGVIPRSCGAPPEKVSERVNLSLIPDTTSIYAGDPLIVKVVLRNTGKTPVALPKVFDARWAGIRFEVRPPNETAFVRAYAVQEGKNCGAFIGKNEVGAGTSIVSYERLFWGAGKPLFSTTGKWQVRTLVTIGDEVVTSTPVSLTVTEPPERVKRALQTHTRLISERLDSWFSSAEDLKTMPEARDQLEGASAAQIIAGSLLLCELRSAGSAKARRLALEAVNKHRADLSPVAREEFDLLTAKVLCSQGDYTAAKKILDAIPELSDARDGLRGTVEAMLAAERK